MVDSEPEVRISQFGTADLERRVRFGGIGADERGFIDEINGAVLDHLARHAQAQGLLRRARLMGAMVIVTGLSADVAQSLVTLGVDLSRLNTMGDPQGGIEEAERILGPATPRAERHRLAAV